MSWKYRQEYVRDGDVVEPSDWRININETVSEINGFLDSDNIGHDSIDVNRVKRGAFTEVHNNFQQSLCYIFNHTQSGWIRETETTVNIDIGDAIFRLPDEPAVSAAYKELGLDVYSSDPGGPSGTSLEVRTLPSVTFTPNEDGLLIVEFSGTVNWLGTQSNPDGYIKTRHSAVVEGTTEHGTDNYGFFAKQTKRFKQLSSFVLCSMWRLTVNGQSVAETGPLGNEYQCHPIYLCGATPVLKNKETIVQLEAQFIWYNLGKDQSESSSSFNPLQSFNTAQFGNEARSYRKDCSLFCPSLVVTYRKR